MPIPGRPLAVAMAITAVAWLAVAESSAFGGSAATVIGIGILVTAAVSCLVGRITAALTLVAYLAPLQPAFRLYAPDLPYLTFEYALLIVAILVVVRSSKNKWSQATLCFGVFAAVELIDLLRADSWLMARAVLFPTLGLLSMLTIADKWRPRQDQYQAVVAGFLAGTAGLAALVLRAYATGQVVVWSRTSNFEASAGMGPNQVSLMFAVASFLCLVYADGARLAVKVGLRTFVGVLALFMILTFSRGGLYILVGAVVSYYILLTKPSRRQLGAVAASVILIVAALQISLSVTDGTVVERYSEATTSNRTELLLHAWDIFLENPAIGLGTGRFFLAVTGTDRLGIMAGAHNELGRAAAEHGIVGLATWASFVVLSILVASRRATGSERALRVTLTLMAFVIMFYNGLKLITPPLLLFLASVRVDALIPAIPLSPRQRPGMR